MAEAEVRGLLSPSEYRRPGSRMVHFLCLAAAVLLAIIMSTLALPTFAYLIPSYLFIKDLGLYDSW